jgi:isopenicillin N synthase-like dioxygenase
MAATIPVIDLASALGGDPVARLRTGREIDRTCTEIGFFTITGHGVPAETIRALNRTPSSPCRWRRR